MMKFLSSDCQSMIYGHIWYPAKQPVGMIQIIHGITEHMQRYEYVAKYLNDLGFIVYGIDLVGHGDPLYQSKIKGYFGKEGSWIHVCNDVFYCYTMMKNRFPDLPCYFIGFSKGSFIAKTLLIQKNNELDIKGCFLLETGTQPVFILKIIKCIVKRHCYKIGEEKASNFIDQLAFGTYNKKFKNTQSSVDWLLKNEKERQIYRDDKNL